MDDIGARLLAAKVGEQWQPTPMIRRVEGKIDSTTPKGLKYSSYPERLQQLWNSNLGNLSWRDVPIFKINPDHTEVQIDEGATAINPIRVGPAAPTAANTDVPKS